MDKKLLDNAKGHLNQFVQAGKDAMKNMQEHPMGHDPRSKKEIGIIMSKLQSLPREERQVRMTELANLMGHKGDKLDNCEMCQYIKDSMLNRK